MVLHGHDDDPAETARFGAAVRAAAARPDLVVHAPSGPVTTGGTRRAWWETGDDGLPTGDGIIGALAALDAALADVAEDVPGPVVLAGFSQGAALVLAHLLAGPAPTVGAAATVAGWIPDDEGFDPDPAGLGDVVAPTFVGVGLDDEVVPPPATRSAAKLLERHGVPVTLVALEVAHDPAPFVTDLGRWLAGLG